MFPSLDFAGGSVVHISSGVWRWFARYAGQTHGLWQDSDAPAQRGACGHRRGLLWVGWFGFNAGSALQANGLASNAFMTTHVAGAAATLSWLFLEWLLTGKPTVLGGISGAVAGLAMITPASGFTTPMYAMLIGATGGIVCFFGATRLKHWFSYDDTLDAFGVHGVSGTFGTILAGVFAVAAINGHSGLVEGNVRQVFNQLVTTAIAWTLAAAGTFVFLKITDLACGLRVDQQAEFDGLDLSQHGEAGYNFEEEPFGSAPEEEKELAPAAT